jgi:hypothetical protein
MNTITPQEHLPGMEMAANGTKELTPAQTWDEDIAKHSLDELFCNARHYRSSQSYRELIDYISRFRFYAPYNAMLLHVQMPGAEFVAPATRWLNQYGRILKADARPLVILQPMGPVMFVFDVSDTEPGPKAFHLPKAVTNPFDGLSGLVGTTYERTIENAKRDGVLISEKKEGSQSAGSISSWCAKGSQPMLFQIGTDPQKYPIFVPIPIRYSILLNAIMSREAKYATIVHELAHIYCGHIGTPNVKWWPDRMGLNETVREFEAESVAYLVCARQGIKTPSVSYLSEYLSKNTELPKISLECVLKAAGLIETMGTERMKLRKEKEG